MHLILLWTFTIKHRNDRGKAPLTYRIKGRKKASKQIWQEFHKWHMVNAFKMLSKTNPKPGALALSRDSWPCGRWPTNRLKVGFRLCLVKRWRSRNANVTRCIFFHKEAVTPLCPSLPFFPSVLERVSLFSKPDDLHGSSESHSLPPLLRLCCIQSLQTMSCFLLHYQLLPLLNVLTSSCSGRKLPQGIALQTASLTSPPGESQLQCPLPNLCKAFLGR